MNSNQKKPVKTTGSGDSLFGMTLAVALLGFAYGPSLELAWKAGEACSAIYEDRLKMKKRTNGRGVYELGVRGKLAGTFTRNTARKNEPFLPAQWMKPVSSLAFAP